MEEMDNASLDASSLDDEAFKLEAGQDKCILRLIASCCNSDKLERATELVKLLTLEKLMKGAIKLVTTLKLPNLAERFSSILEGVDLMVRSAKKSMVDELEAMLDVVDPQPTGTSVSFKRRTFDMPDGVIRKEIEEGVAQGCANA